MGPEKVDFFASANCRFRHLRNPCGESGRPGWAAEPNTTSWDVAVGSDRNLTGDGTDSRSVRPTAEPNGPFFSRALLWFDPPHHYYELSSRILNKSIVFVLLRFHHHHRRRRRSADCEIGITRHLRTLLLIASLSLVWISGYSSVPSRDFLGIAPQDESYYMTNVIKCKDGSKKFTKEQLNDDFCDCPDGTDEPGTSACPEGKFYCRNVGHTPITIFSSRVNDGICDCCDGSDEYDGKVNCSNTCWEAGKVAREKLKKKIETYEEGVVIRMHEVDKAKRAFAKDEAELSKLKSDEKILKGLVQKLKEHKERIEKAEEEERLKKEKEEKRLEAERKASEQEKSSEESSHDITEGVQDNGPESSDQDGPGDSQDAAVEAKIDQSNESEKLGKEQDDLMVEAHTLDDTTSEEASPRHAAEKEHGSESSGDTKGLSKEELGRLVASRWTGQNAEQETNNIDNSVEEEPEDNQDIPDSAQEDGNGGYASEYDEDKHKYDDDSFEDGSDDEFEDDEPGSSYNSEESGKTDFSEFTASTSPSWLEKIQQTVQNVLETLNFFKTPVDLSEADRVRKEYDDSSSKLSKLQSRISSLAEKLKHDLGKEKEFYSFYDQCFENKQNKYVYKVCPFKKASQVEGHSTTILGSWEKFEDSYRVMQFSNGDKCWNGPDRSLKVRLRCGLKNELADVDEPSRCEYVALLSTPVLCLEEKLKELKHKLEQINTSQTSIKHDEL